KPTCRFFTFAAASTRGSRTILLRLKGDIRSLAVKSRSSLRRTRDIIRSHRRIRRRGLTLSPGQLYRLLSETLALLAESFPWQDHRRQAHLRRQGSVASGRRRNPARGC